MVEPTQPADTSAARRIVQLAPFDRPAPYGPALAALADDGTAWRLNDEGWHPLADLPQGPMDEVRAAITAAQMEQSMRYLGLRKGSLPKAGGEAT